MSAATSASVTTDCVNGARQRSKLIFTSMYEINFEGLSDPRGWNMLSFRHGWQYFLKPGCSGRHGLSELVGMIVKSSLMQELSSNIGQSLVYKLIICPSRDPSQSRISLSELYLVSLQI
jgi:hypothetical protein